MTQDTKTGRQLRADKRKARLADQLRSNLKKRKDQVRGRIETERPANHTRGREERSGS